MELIQGKIAAIVDRYKVVINRGHEHGVKLGMRFVIYEPGENILDPDTGESLGEYEYIKAKVKVIDVNQKYSTLSTDSVSNIPLSAVLANFNASLTSVSRREQLPLPEDFESSIIRNPSDIIKTGDFVRQLLE